MRKLFNLFLCGIILLLLSAGCQTAPEKRAEANLKTQKMLDRPTYNQVRQITALPLEVYADTITVQQFRRVCDVLARNLVIQSFVTHASRPPVVTVRKLENKSEIDIDESIFQETIRAKLIEYSRGLILFRDDASYRDIIVEKARQNSGEIQVSMTDSMVETRTVDRIREREFDGGSLSGSYGKHEGDKNIEQVHKVEMMQEATVKSKVAAADYFLRGIIYQINERHANRPEEGMSYFQYQFRVVDARTGIIVWEKMLSSKMEGSYGVQPGGGGVDDQGAAPASWPSGQGTIGNVQPNQGNNAAPPPEQGISNNQPAAQALPAGQGQPASPFQNQ